MHNCLSDKIFSDLLAGSASAEQMTAWKRHLRECDSCAKEFIRHQAGLKSSVAEPGKVSDSSDSGGGLHMDSLLEPNIQIGDFKIEKRLGSGGMGTVYQARQLSLNRHVALKVLSPGLAKKIEIR